MIAYAFRIFHVRKLHDPKLFVTYPFFVSVHASDVFRNYHDRSRYLNIGMLAVSGDKHLLDYRTDKAHNKAVRARTV